MSDNILIREAYEKTKEIDAGQRNWYLTKANAPREGMVLCHSPNLPRGFEAWFKGGQIIKATTAIPGAQIEVDQANRYFQAGLYLGKALSSCVYFPEDDMTPNKEAGQIIAQGPSAGPEQGSGPALDTTHNQNAVQ